MRLTNYTDYSLRVLIFLAFKKGGELSTTKEIAENYNISNNHLVKIIHQLGQLGYIETIRGRNGGIKLAKDPKKLISAKLYPKRKRTSILLIAFNNAPLLPLVN